MKGVAHVEVFCIAHATDKYFHHFKFFPKDFVL